jgi:predicted ATPase/DNA-binding winged helix-turn-helix (wHTH) protein
VDFSNSQLWQGEKLVHLHPKAWAILRYLITQEGRAVSLAELCRTIWPETIVSPGNVKVYINEIRNALQDDRHAPRFIETVPRKGYRFISPRNTPTQVSPSSLADFHDLFAAPKNPNSPTLPQLTADDRAQRLHLVGRKRELERLYRGLNKTLTRQRQLLFVSGEPGLGKTALMSVFQEQLAVSPHQLWATMGRCVEHYGAGEAYLPVLDALEQLHIEARRAILLPLLQQYAPTWLERLPSLFPRKAREVAPPVDPVTARERMLREFARTIEILTEHIPLVLILEDLHWSDHSTLNLLTMLAQRREPARLLVIGTYRPEEIHAGPHPLRSLLQELHAHRRCDEIMLAPLSEKDIQVYINTRFSPHSFPAAFTHVLHQRTAGNPLFLTNLLDAFIERAILVRHEKTWALAQPLASLEQEVPESFRLLLEKQSARLTTAEQQLLSTASVAGLEFSAAAVAAVLSKDVVRIEEQCEQLARRRQFLRPAGVSEWPGGARASCYAFHHALLREAWRTRLPAAQQQRLHLQFGKRLEAAYRQHEEEIASELAMHFAAGRDLWRAAHYHAVAGEKACTQLAYQEAIDHFSSALSELGALPNSRKRSAQELRLQLALTTPLIATKGWAAPETWQAYARAHELSQQLGSLAEQFAVLFGLWIVAYTRAKLRAAHELAQQLLQLAHRTRAVTLQMKAHHALGNTLHRMGQLHEARVQLEHGVQLYKQHQSHSQALRYGLDDGVAGLGYLAWVLWALGYQDQGQRTTDEMLALAQELAHPLDIAWALNTAAWHSQFQRAEHAAKRYAEAETSLCQEHGFTQLQAVGLIVKGWTSASLGVPQEGIQLMEDGITAAASTGATIGRPRYLTVLAEAYGKIRQFNKAFALLTQAERLTTSTEERFYEAELHRLRGELTLQQSHAQAARFKSRALTLQGFSFQAEAQACFRKAITVARRQGAKLLELRAMVSLCRLFQQQHKDKHAHRQLAKVLGWFTEGEMTSDVQEARLLLDELEKASANQNRALPTSSLRRSALFT